jgi:hypothetical protein
MQLVAGGLHTTRKPKPKKPKPKPLENQQGIIRGVMIEPRLSKSRFPEGDIPW